MTTIKIPCTNTVLSPEWSKETKQKFENKNQNVFKRVMNTCYGLYGMSGFRYSDNWLARSITNNSLHALKIAMFKAEEYLTELYK